MTVAVFIGPTCRRAEAEAVLDALYLPPVAQGKLYRAARTRPRAIGIVDGYFQQTPAVWHKEILWAMAQGIHVFGSASMGALRAAELAPFGMEGIGRIFEAFRDGLLEDDDEVAVTHGPAELGYVATSEAMVDIRATLSRAEASGIIGGAVRSALEQHAKDLFYADRSYPRLLADGRAMGLPRADLDGLRAWLPEGKVDRKRADALAMLHHIGAWLDTDPAPKRVRYRFEHTAMWAEASRFIDSEL